MGAAAHPGAGAGTPGTGRANAHAVDHQLRPHDAAIPESGRRRAAGDLPRDFPRRDDRGQRPDDPGHLPGGRADESLEGCAGGQEIFPGTGNGARNVPRARIHPDRCGNTGRADQIRQCHRARPPASRARPTGHHARNPRGCRVRRPGTLGFRQIHAGAGTAGHLAGRAGRSVHRRRAHSRAGSRGTGHQPGIFAAGRGTVRGLDCRKRRPLRQRRCRTSDRRLPTGGRA